MMPLAWMPPPVALAPSPPVPPTVPEPPKPPLPALAEFRRNDGVVDKGDGGAGEDGAAGCVAAAVRLVPLELGVVERNGVARGYVLAMSGAARAAVSACPGKATRELAGAAAARVAPFDEVELVNVTVVLPAMAPPLALLPVLPLPPFPEPDPLPPRPPSPASVLLGLALDQARVQRRRRTRRRRWRGLRSRRCRPSSRCRLRRRLRRQQSCWRGRKRESESVPAKDGPADRTAAHAGRAAGVLVVLPPSPPSPPSAELQLMVE